MNTQAFSGVQYLNKGFHLIWQPEIKKFVFIPLLINFVLLTIATIYAFGLIADWQQSLPIWLNTHINSPHWYISWPAAGLNWIVGSLDWLLWPLIIATVLISVFFVFGFLANWIAAPFNGLLSEAVERHLNPSQSQPLEFKWSAFMKDLPRLLGREWRKLTYYLPKAIGCLILLLTPLSLFVPIIWFLFNSWMSAIQYIDYPEDNHQRTFQQTLENIRQHRKGALGFGMLVMLLTMIPIVNILVMPVAVAGATNLWVDHLQKNN